MKLKCKDILLSRRAVDQTFNQKSHSCQNLKKNIEISFDPFTTTFRQIKMIWNIDRKKYVKFTLVLFDSFKVLMNTTPNVHQQSWFLNQRKLLCNTKTRWHWPKGNFTNFLHFVNQNSAKFNSRFTGTTISTSQTKTVHCLFQRQFSLKITNSDNFNKIQNQYIYVNCFWSLNNFI